MTRKAIIALLLALLLCVSPLFADDYTIPSYSMSILVGEDAVLHVDETIEADFNRPLHGLYREIPIGYLNGMRAKVSNVKGNRPFEEYESGRNYVKYRFGTEDEVFTGAQEYRLTYDYDIGTNTDDRYDEMYFNLVGEGWQQTLEKCFFSITFPSAIDPSLVWLTRGEYGSKASDGVTWWMDDKSGNKTILVTADDMQPGEELTIRVQLPNAYYVGAREYVNRTPMYFIITVVGSLLAIGLCALIWKRFGKDTVPVFYAESTPPEGMTPLQMGYLADESVDIKDITSMIFYWADKGLLQMDKGTGRKEKYTFTKLKDIGDEALPMERYLFDSFFKCGNDGVVTEEDLSKDFYESMEKAKEKVKNYYKGPRKTVNTKSELWQVASLFIGMIPLVLASLTLTWDYVGFATLGFVIVGFVYEIIQFIILYFVFVRWYMLKMPKALVMFFSLIPTILILLLVFIVDSLVDVLALQMIACFLAIFSLATVSFFAAITRKRSEYGQKLLQQILGYREFLEKVEMDKLKMMIDSDPEVYYHNLSYAIVLGLEDKWARKFDGIKLQPPQWYTGNDFVFNAIFFSHMARNWNTKMQTVIMPKSSSSSSPGLRFGGSSFGGSGFSGGGFGGGGGGAW